MTVVFKFRFNTKKGGDIHRLPNKLAWYIFLTEDIAHFVKQSFVGQIEVFDFGQLL